MEEAWPALGLAAGDSAFRPPPPPGTIAPTPVAWGAAATAQRETVAKESSAQAVSRIVSSCANSSGLAVAVVDANASTAGRLVTMPEVLEEVRNAAARRRLALLPTPVEPAPEFLKLENQSNYCIENIKFRLTAAN
ncbi:RNA-binding NOB1-like protein [Triticum urartu]|uniref:RNA-binding NOB1-like protein n=1 Tax=Triticum urartu TaxID=4572 RepID=UPI002042D148|nr:RNA-binding NOB1-like protein [Triticum urartu]